MLQNDTAPVHQASFIKTWLISKVKEAISPFPKILCGKWRVSTFNGSDIPKPIHNQSKTMDLKLQSESENI